MSPTCTAPDAGSTARAKGEALCSAGSRGRRFLAGVALLSLALSSACSTRYQPQTGPRLSVVMDGGSLAYARDGKTYRHGFAGSGLVQAVEDDPEAREAAERYQSRMLSGLALSLVGTVCFATGMVVGLQSIDEDRRSDSKDALIGGALLCGMGGLIAGGALFAAAQPYQWDAINIYNDHVERRRQWWPGGAALPARDPVWYPAPHAPPPASSPLPPPGAQQPSGPPHGALQP